MRLSTLLSIILMTVSGCSPAEGDLIPAGKYFIEHPISQAVKLNGKFTLRCRFRNYLFQESPRPVVQWSLNGFGLGVSREDIREAGKIPGSGESRYDLPENLDEGLYDLQVRDASTVDEGKYVCQINHKGNTTISQTADVRVLVQSNPPEIIQWCDDNALERLGPAKPASVKEGNILRLNCVAKSGKPGAKLSWFLRGKPLTVSVSADGAFGHINSGVVGNVTEVRDTSSKPPFLVTTVSKLAVYVTKLEHGLMINCSAQNEGYEGYLLPQAYTTLKVLYAPVVKLHMQPPTGRQEFLENDVAVLRCTADGRPDNYIWREMLHVTVACIATTFDSGTDKVKLSFQYGPRFPDDQPLIFAGAIGEPLKMGCFAEGNPKPQVEWRWAGSAGFSAVLTRSEYHIRPSIQAQDFGNYICTAKSPGFPPASRKIILAQKSAPQIKPMSPVYAAIGATARIPCTIHAIPLPPAEGLLWFRRDVILRQSAHRKFSMEEFLGGVVFVMSFKQVMSTDYGFYNCSAVNAYGTAWQTVEMKREDELSLASVSGILAALLVAVILALLMFYCCRRRHCRKSEEIGKNIGNLTGKPSSLMLNGSSGYIQSQTFPQAKMESQNDNNCRKSVSESTEGESFSHYQYPPTNSSNIFGQPMSSNDQVTLRPLSPVCKYTLVDSQGQQIPVCTNVLTLSPDHPNGLQLTDGGGGICLSPQYQSIPVSYVNLGCSGNMAFSSDAANADDSSVHHLGFVPVSAIPVASDVIINTQVTTV